jgi:sRNA-binding protein
MHVSEDGSVVGSVDRSKLEEIEATSDEAKAELERLQAEAAAAEEEAAKLLESRTPEAEVPEPEPETEPVDGQEGDGNALRAEYLKLTGKEADGRWGVERLRSEVDTAKES